MELPGLNSLGAVHVLLVWYKTVHEDIQTLNFGQREAERKFHRS